MTMNLDHSRCSIKTRAVLGSCAVGLALLPVSASAHTGLGVPDGFVHGFAHPLSGPDHVLAMTAVGLLAAQLGGRALWLLPSTFVVVMALAGLAGMAGVSLSFVEIGIGMSVVVLGLAVASQLRMPTLIATSLVGFFAVFHGHAHGTEMPQSMPGLAYGVGFVSATALLHAIGIGSGLAMAKLGSVASRRMVQLGGAAIAVAGAAILASP
jgi:urease accessory protein